MKNDNRINPTNSFTDRLAKRLEEPPRIAGTPSVLPPVRIHKVQPEGYVSEGLPKVHKFAL